MAENDEQHETQAEAAAAEDAATEAAEPAEPGAEPAAPAAEPAAEEPAAEEPAAEPAAEAEPLDAADDEPPAADEPEDGDASAEAGEPAQPRRKRKRLPRRLRPQKTRPRRPAATAGGRKPVVREPKPPRERGRRQERRGVVVSDAMDKTIVVKVDVIASHPRYKKVIRRSVKFHAHDERNEAKLGDVVRIVETRPLSATKRWRLAEILEQAR